MKNYLPRCPAFAFVLSHGHLFVTCSVEFVSTGPVPKPTTVQLHSNMKTFSARDTFAVGPSDLFGLHGLIRSIPGEI